MGKNWKQRQILFSWSLKSLWMMTAAMKLKKQKTKKQKTKKQHLLLRKKAVINLVSILKKQKHHFADKGPFNQICGFSSRHVQMWQLDHEEGWALKNRCFQMWFWRRLFRVPWTARRSNQSTLKEISPEYSLEGLVLKLKLQYFGHLMGRTDSLEKTLMLGKIEGRRRRGW